jgi:DNA invertase Pin-like site-specific DNA recombinase
MHKLFKPKSINKKSAIEKVTNNKSTNLNDKDKTYIYCRVSTKGQATQDKFSIDVQRDICLKYAQKKNLFVDGIFQEIGSAFQSSYEKNQVKLTSLIKKRNCNIIIMNVDRFCRNINNGKEMIHRIVKNKNRLIFVENKIILDKNINSEFETLLGSAEGESRKISDRIRLTNEYKRKNGIHIGGVAKYGFEIVKSNKGNVLSSIPNEQNIIDLIKCMRVPNTPMKDINALLGKLYHGNDFIGLDLSTNCDRISEPLSYKNIADILNDYDIKKRQNIWTASSVSAVIDKKDRMKIVKKKKLVKKIKKDDLMVDENDRKRKRQRKELPVLRKPRCSINAISAMANNINIDGDEEDLYDL